MSEGVYDQALPVLNYADANADGSAEWILEAEELIQRGGSPRQIRHLFPKTEQAVGYFAKSMARRCASQLTDSCSDCGAKNPPFVAQVFWLAKANFRTFEFRVQGAARTLNRTFHPLCYECAKNYHRRIFHFVRVRRYLRLFNSYSYLAIFILGFIALASARRRIFVLMELSILSPLLCRAVDSILKLIWRRQLPVFLRKLERPGWKVQHGGAIFIRRGDALYDTTLMSK